MLGKMIRRAFQSSDPSLRAGAGVADASPAIPPSRWTYESRELATTHNVSCLDDPRFQRAYRLGAESGHRYCRPEDLRIEWRVYTCCWAAEHALRLPGDFVECGVNTGITSRAVANYVNFSSMKRRLWLIDTFDGIPLDQATKTERALAASKNTRHYFDSSHLVRTHFSDMPNVQVIKGRVPDVLQELEIGDVAYLHIDMNIATPEVAALEHFWDKMTVGAITVLDDYGSLAHTEQKSALDLCAHRLGVTILTLPTGQGILIKA